ncbi:MAG: hypothetical protein NUW12_01820 [Firmicutes bacterium]|jgi:predicted small integral membrane protein|nr:hypothetical protein [Bacillota bacterium]MDH7494817.1 hypothetical protein [Bacillota bacterium]
MSTSDRIFWGVVTFVFVCLFWLKFVERFLPMWFGTIVAIGAFLGVLAFGRPKAGASRK